MVRKVNFKIVLKDYKSNLKWTMLIAFPYKSLYKMPWKKYYSHIRGIEGKVKTTFPETPNTRLYTTALLLPCKILCKIWKHVFQQNNHRMKSQNGSWKWLKGYWMVTGKVVFNRISFTIQWTFTPLLMCSEVVSLSVNFYRKSGGVRMRRHKTSSSAQPDVPEFLSFTHRKWVFLD